MVYQKSIFLSYPINNKSEREKAIIGIVITEILAHLESFKYFLQMNFKYEIIIYESIRGKNSIALIDHKVHLHLPN